MPAWIGRNGHKTPPVAGAASSRMRLGELPGAMHLAGIHLRHHSVSDPCVSPVDCVPCPSLPSLGCPHHGMISTRLLFWICSCWPCLRRRF